MRGLTPAALAAMAAILAPAAAQAPCAMCVTRGALAPTGCAYGSSGADGCGVSPGLYFVPAVNATTQPTAAQWSAWARGSGQAWSNGCSPDPNHCAAWNMAGVDYGVGPNIPIASMNTMDQWGTISGTACGSTGHLCGCAYYRIGDTISNSNLYNLPIPNRFDPTNTFRQALVNVLACTGNGSSAGNPANPVTIDGWNWIDNNPANNGYQQCVLLAIYDNTAYTPGTGTYTISNWAFKVTTRCGGSCPFTGAARPNTTPIAPPFAVTDCPPNITPNNVGGFISASQSLVSPIVLRNGYKDDQWDQPCCATQPYAFATISYKPKSDITVQFNDFEHSRGNIVSLGFLAGAETACANGVANPGLGPGWPYKGYNLNISFNVIDGIGHYNGYGHGEVKDGGVTDTNPISDASATLSGTVLTTSTATNIAEGSTIWWSGMTSAQGGVYVTAANGTNTYAVINRGGASFTNIPIKADASHMCQETYAYNTFIAPTTSAAGGMTTVFYGLNSSGSYTDPTHFVMSGFVEAMIVDHNVIVENNIVGAPGTLLASGNFNYITPGGSDPNCVSSTPYSNGNCIIILGAGSGHGGVTCPSDGGFAGPYLLSATGGGTQLGLNKFAYCDADDRAHYWMGCPSPAGAICPILYWDAAPYAGTQILNGFTVTGGSVGGGVETLTTSGGSFAAGQTIAVEGVVSSNASDWTTGYRAVQSTAGGAGTVSFANAGASGTYVSGGSVAKEVGSTTWVYGIVSRGIAFHGHNGIGAFIVTNNEIDATGVQTGTYIQVNGAGVFCIGSPVISGNLGLRDGDTVNVNSRANLAGVPGCP